jgi:hypothetical protein
VVTTNIQAGAAVEKNKNNSVFIFIGIIFFMAIILAYGLITNKGAMNSKGRTNTLPSILESVEGPKVNTMSCPNSFLSDLPVGAVGCYGILEYHSEFGGNADMCPTVYDKTTPALGCEVKTSACRSGRAVASKIYFPTSVLDINSSDLERFSVNLKSSPRVVKEQIPMLWEYVCVEVTNSK